MILERNVKSTLTPFGLNPGDTIRFILNGGATLGFDLDRSANVGNDGDDPLLLVMTGMSNW